jgi:hypothetical protein
MDPLFHKLSTMVRSLFPLARATSRCAGGRASVHILVLDPSYLSLCMMLAKPVVMNFLPSQARLV